MTDENESQIDAQRRTFVTVLRKHYEGLLEGGFTHEEALYLTAEFQYSIVMSHKPARRVPYKPVKKADQ